MVLRIYLLHDGMLEVIFGLEAVLCRPPRRLRRSSLTTRGIFTCKEPLIKSSTWLDIGKSVNEACNIAPGRLARRGPPPLPGLAQ